VHGSGCADLRNECGKYAVEQKLDPEQLGGLNPDLYAVAIAKTDTWGGPPELQWAADRYDTAVLIVNRDRLTSSRTVPRRKPEPARVVVLAFSGAHYDVVGTLDSAGGDPQYVHPYNNAHVMPAIEAIGKKWGLDAKMLTRTLQRCTQFES
jgi:hypothetical protein